MLKILKGIENLNLNFSNKEKEKNKMEIRKKSEDDFIVENNSLQYLSDNKIIPNSNKDSIKESNKYSNKKEKTSKKRIVSKKSNKNKSLLQMKMF